jgi:hypothetical protein
MVLRLVCGVVLLVGVHASPVHKPPQITRKLEKQILLKFGPVNSFTLVSRLFLPYRIQIVRFLTICFSYHQRKE